MAGKLTGYDLSRQWFEMVWETPELTANHTALYMLLCHIWNKLGQPDRFQITSTECMKGMGVKSYKTYKKTFDELVEMGCINLLKQSSNQYQCNVIGMVKFDKAPAKALTKALTNSHAKASPIFKETTNYKLQTSNLKDSAPQKEDAVPAQDSEALKTKSEKKENVPLKEKKERTDLHHRIIGIYSKFMLDMNGVKPQITGQDAEGAKRIIDYLKTIVKGEKTDEEVCLALEFIFSHWQKLDKFERGQVKLVQIAANLNSIITQFRKQNLKDNVKQPINEISVEALINSARKQESTVVH